MQLGQAVHAERCPPVRSARAARRRWPWRRAARGGPAATVASSSGASAPSRTLGASSRRAPGGPAGRCRPRPASATACRAGRSAVAQEPDVVRRRCGRPARSPGSTPGSSAAPARSAARPDHRVGDAGQHGDLRRNRPPRVDQSGELAEHLTTAYLDRADLGDPVASWGDPPVVSRSTTTNVTSRSGSPSSSKLCCPTTRWSAPPAGTCPRPAPAVTLVTPVTLGPTTDTAGDVRRRRGDGGEW